MNKNEKSINNTEEQEEEILGKAKFDYKAQKVCLLIFLHLKNFCFF